MTRRCRSRRLVRCDPAVDVIFHGAREIVIDDQRHVLHVEPASGDVRGEHHRRASLAKLRQHELAFFLTLIAVDGERREAVVSKPSSDVVDPRLGG